MRKCPRCGMENPDDAYFCRYCYYPLVEGAVLKVEVPRAERSPRIRLSRGLLLTSLVLNVVYHVSLPFIFSIMFYHNVIVIVNTPYGEATPVIGGTGLNFLTLFTLLELAAAALGGAAIKGTERGFLYVLYPLGLLGQFFSFSSFVYPNPLGLNILSIISGVAIIAGGSFFSIIMREALESRLATYSSLALLFYYFVVATMPLSVSFLGPVNAVVSAVLLYVVTKEVR
ncbi:MAG: zinc ribbon domain-containing protein [Sulfolobales archaeon]|nr:zinc ribbon domain-containing protein [Sulfolobales archaeon]